MVVRVFVSAAIAFAAMVLMLVIGKYAPIVGYLAIYPGGMLAMAVGHVWSFLGRLPDFGDDGPAVFGSVTLFCSFAFWWVVAFMVLAHRHQRRMLAIKSAQ